MHIDSIDLCNFRNYDQAELAFHRHTNILYGDNAQGKTNILEALYVCSTTKSHKGSKDRELIRLGQEEAHLRIHLTRHEISHRIDMHLRKNKPKGIAIDGIPIRRSGELMGLVNIIFFAPEDLGIIKNGPAERRRFIDMELCQLDPVYLNDLGQYRKILNQRNKLLKQIYYNPSLQDTLEAWDAQLLEYGGRIIRRREEFVDQLKEIVYERHLKLTGGKEKLLVQYDKSTPAEDFEKNLQQSRERDLKLMMTGVGPHRDDLSFYQGEVDLRKYGSQGQQRTCALSLKLSEIRLVRELTGDQPVLLLDDVLSELDRNRQNYLLDSLQDVQTMITCTGLEEFVDSRLELDRVFHIVEGTVQLVQEP